MESVLLDAAGHRRSPATMPGYHRGRPPRNKGEEYPADPPTVEEIVAVMRAVGERPDGHRLRALIVLLWRAGLRISEALALQESDLDRGRGAVLVRRGKGGKRREVGMDRSGPLLSRARVDASQEPQKRPNREPSRTGPSEQQIPAQPNLCAREMPVSKTGDSRFESWLPRPACRGKVPPIRAFRPIHRPSLTSADGLRTKIAPVRAIGR
jgi:hypothetical protein